MYYLWLKHSPWYINKLFVGYKFYPCYKHINFLKVKLCPMFLFLYSYTSSPVPGKNRQLKILNKYCIGKPAVVLFYLCYTLFSSCFNIWINKHVFHQTDESEEITSNTSLFYRGNVLRKEDEWNTHTHTVNDVSAVKNWYLSIQNEQMNMSWMADWQSGHSIFYHPPIKKQSLFSYP